ncbi:hypothetical protein [Ferruginibacter sp.]
MSAISLLLLMLCVHIVQVTHTHTYKTGSTPVKTANADQHNKEYHAAKTDTRCFICEYQLVRDADSFASSFNIEVPLSFISTTPAITASVVQDTYSCFETRGPPVTA